MPEKDQEKLDNKYYPDERDKYEYFWRSQSVFSRWYQFDFEVEGNKFGCIEEYMMCQKAVLMTDDERTETTSPSYDPRDLEQEGKYINNLSQDLWDEKCVDIVEAGIVAKFSQNGELKQKLLNTYPKTLVEASPIDKVWGIGLGEDDRRAWNEQTWKGQNLFGKVLTKVRDKLMTSNLEPGNPDKAEKVKEQHLQENDNGNHAAYAEWIEMSDESENVQRPNLEKEEFNDGSDREKTEENAVNQATENRQRNGLMDIGADEDRQEVPGEDSTEKNVSDTWTPPNCNTSPKSELNESQAAGACCQANSIKDKENDGRNKRDSQSKEIDMDSKSENVEEVKEEHYGYQLKPKQDNQKQHDGTGGGGHSKKGKKKKKTTWKKLDLQQDGTIPESQYTGSHSQRNFMQTKKHNDGENQRFQNRGGERDSKHKNFGVGREENKHRSVPGNQSQHGGNEWPSPCSKNFTEGNEHHNGGNQRNSHSKESGKNSGNHAANAELIDMSELRGNHDNQRQYGSSERHSTEARKSTEDERYGNEETQRDVHHRESDRKPADEGNWKEIAQKQKRKPGIQRQYGGSGDDRHSSNSRKNKRKDIENNSDFQGEKNSENDSSWERTNKKGGGERRHNFYPDEREKYEYFWKSHSVFSQWYLSNFEVDGIEFNCAEKYMMYQKAVLMEDYEIANDILDLEDPCEMKKQGRYVRNFDQKLWDDNCTEIVEAGNYAKFSQNKNLQQKLLNTYPKILVNANPMDGIWGIGLAEDDSRAWNQKTWKGKNMLGKVLTTVRDRLMGSFLDHVRPEETMKRAGGTINTRHTNPSLTQSVGEAKTAQAPVGAFTAVSPTPTKITTSDRKPRAIPEDSRCTVS